MHQPLGSSSPAACVSIIVILLAIPVGWSTPAGASTCSATAFGCAPTGICILSGTWNIGSDCVLDFGARAVEIKGTLQAATRSGSFEVRAAEVTLNGGKLRSLGDADEPGGSITLLSEGAFTLRGSGPRIDTSGHGGGGAIDVSAASIDLQTGVIAADGGADENCDDAGVVALHATGTLSSAIPIHAMAGTNCGGGEVALTGSGVSVTGDIDAHGGAWASDEAIVLTALVSDVTVSGLATLNASGTGQADGYGADGGQVSIAAAAGSIALGGSSVVASGRAPYGSGGSVSLVASQNVLISSRLSLPGGSNGYGGEVFADAGGTLTVTGDILVPGGASIPYGQGGVVELFSSGDATIASTVDASAVVGGDIAMESRSAVTVSGQVTTRGLRVSGGSIDVAGCSVTVNGTLDSGGSNGGSAGSVELDGATIALQSGAVVQAIPCSQGSCVALVTPSGTTSIHPAAVVMPAPISTVVPDLAVCD